MRPAPLRFGREPRVTDRPVPKIPLSILRAGSALMLQVDTWFRWTHVRVSILPWFGPSPGWNLMIPGRLPIKKQIGDKLSCMLGANLDVICGTFPARHA